MLIAITGKNAAGKTEVCRIMEKHGYSYYSLSDAVREEAKKNGIEPTRDNLISIANKVRENEGPGCWAKRTAIKEAKAVIDSIRHPAEVEELKKKRALKLIAVDAPIETRFQRSKKRARPGDGETLEEFKANEQKEMTEDENRQQLGRTIELADIRIENTGTLEELEAKVRETLSKLQDLSV